MKASSEPPKGIKNSITRTFQTVVDQDFLDKVKPSHKWRKLVFSICFMHSVIHERKKFGSLGFCIPYIFNSSDLEASLFYIEKHLTKSESLNLSPSFESMIYMISDVQYGGKITDA